MNKQELIKEFEEIGIHGLNMFGTVVKGIPTKTAIDLIKQLDEPEKVKVPQVVAEKIEYFKKTGDWDLFQAMDSLFGRKETREWLEYKNNQETFARAWLDGYEVEEEKHYKIEIKGVSENSVLIHDKTEECWFFEDGNNEDTIYVYHTRKELEEAGFGWVFNCEGIEIEEVEG